VLGEALFWFAEFELTFLSTKKTVFPLLPFVLFISSEVLYSCLSVKETRKRELLEYILFWFREVDSILVGS